jgi:hypothetical protein
LIEPQNQGRVSWLSLKTKVDDFWFGPQNRQLWLGYLSLKITASISLFVPQNQVGYGLSVASQNRREDDSTRGTRRDLAACFTWKQVTLEFPSLA